MRSNGIFWGFGTEVAAITWGNSVIYDDDLKSQELVRQIFEPTGCDVITAVCGPVAMELFQQHRWRLGTWVIAALQFYTD